MVYPASEEGCFTLPLGSRRAPQLIPASERATEQAHEHHELIYINQGVESSATAHEPY